MFAGERRKRARSPSWPVALSQFGVLSEYVSKEVRGEGRIGRILISSRAGKDSVEQDKREEGQKVETAEGSNNALSTVGPGALTTEPKRLTTKWLPTDKKSNVNVMEWLRVTVVVCLNDNR